MRSRPFTYSMKDCYIYKSMRGILKKCSYLLVGAYVGLGEGANDGRPVVGFGVGIFGRYVGARVGGLLGALVGDFL